MLDAAYKLPEDRRADEVAAAQAQQARWGCDRGPSPGAPDALCAHAARAVGAVLGDEGLFTGCPRRRLYDADVKRVARYRRFLAERGGSASLDAFEPEPPAVLFEAVDAVLEGEAIAQKLWKERLDKKHPPAGQGANLFTGQGRVMRRG